MIWERTHFLSEFETGAVRNHRSTAGSPYFLHRKFGALNVGLVSSDGIFLVLDVCGNVAYHRGSRFGMNVPRRLGSDWILQGGAAAGSGLVSPLFSE